MLAASGAAACAGNAQRSQAPPTLESARRVRYLVAPLVAVAPDTAGMSGTAEQLRYWVARYMTQVGLAVVDDASRPHEIVLGLSLAARGGTVLSYGTASMTVLADSQVLDQWSTIEHVEPAGTFARAVARELVESLVHSQRLAAHADARAGGGGGGAAPGGAGVAIPAVAMSPAPGSAGAGAQGPTVEAVPPPPPARSGDLAAARAHTRQGSAYYDLNRYREAYTEFEQAYLVEQDPALLYNMGQCQRKLGNSEEALHFYRTYLRRAPNGPSSIEADKRIRELEDAMARGRR